MIAIYVALVLTAIPVIDASRRPGVYMSFLVLLTGLLIAVCWTKGEPPRRRAGERDRT